jgi:hypothetical protein
MAMVVCPCCVERTGARCCPPPSQRHAAAEAAFAEVVAQEVNQLAQQSFICDTVHYLDDQVQRGLVRRQTAAWIASSPSNVASSPSSAAVFYPSTLLRCVLQPAKHKTDDCKCVDMVLAWGCCPTQVVFFPAEALMGWSVRTALQMALQYRKKEHQWVRILLTYGCIPCQQYKQLTDKVTGHVTLAPDPVRSSPWFKSRMLQWARWHQRCRKRQWVAAITTNSLAW